jgi:hypothetical protein
VPASGHTGEVIIELSSVFQQQDAKSAGEEEDLRTKEEIEEKMKKQHDQIVRARIRGNEALKKEMLKHVSTTERAEYCVVHARS